MIETSIQWRSPEQLIRLGCRPQFQPTTKPGFALSLPSQQPLRSKWTLRLAVLAPSFNSAADTDDTD